MKSKNFLLAMALLAAGILAGASLGRCEDAVPAASGGGDVSSKEAAMPMMDDKMKEMMMKYCVPGEQHKVLESLVGKWNYTLSMMMPDAKTEESQGTNENKMILGGRFLAQETKGTAMGQPFEGIGMTGYDMMKGEYTSVWMDTMGTGMMTSSAQYDALAKTLSEEGSFGCPMTGEKNRQYKAALKIIDADHYSYEMYFKDETGKEFKAMTISYTRAQ